MHRLRHFNGLYSNAINETMRGNSLKLPYSRLKLTILIQHRYTCTFISQNADVLVSENRRASHKWGPDLKDIANVRKKQDEKRQSRHSYK